VELAHASKRKKKKKRKKRAVAQGRRHRDRAQGELVRARSAALTVRRLLLVACLLVGLLSASAGSAAGMPHAKHGAKACKPANKKKAAARASTVGRPTPPRGREAERRAAVKRATRKRCAKRKARRRAVAPKAPPAPAPSPQPGAPASPPAPGAPAPDDPAPAPGACSARCPSTPSAV
jgi:hypothetical protein